LLDVKPGMRVVDLCAAPGGKSAYLAGLMNDQGEIIAVDKYESRLRIMEKNITRLSFNSVKLVEADALEYNDGEFDRVLADVPCSGTGTLSKKPDIKWKRDLLDIRKMTNLQYKLLEKAAQLVKKDGVVVYSTCSIEPEENFQVVQKFLTEHKNFILKNAGEEFPKDLIDENGCIQTLPQVHQIDGAFAAKLIRVD
jgi:16S rRNA (cytosine967-C5)-methyltransferase